MNHAVQFSLRSHSKARRRPLVSLTPLIDVVFILLIFFMLATNFLQWRAISLDAPPQLGSSVSAPTGAVIGLRADGLWFEHAPLNIERLQTMLAERLAATPDLAVTVRVSPGVPFQDAVDVLDRMRAIGLTNLSLLREAD